MRVAFVAQPFDRLSPPVQGGSLAIWIYQIARVCARRGHNTIVFANHGGSVAAQTTQHENVRYVFTPTSLNRLQNRLAAGWNRRQTVPRFAAAWQDRGYARAAGRRARQLGCDVVHVMNYSQFVPVIRAAHPTARIALHMQCEWLTQLDPALITPRLEAADLIVGCSEYITQKIAAAYPCFTARCVTVPNAAQVVEESEPVGAPTSAAAPGGAAGRVVLFVGRISPEKGVHDLIVAFHDVLKRFPDARLHLVGGIGSAPLEYLVGLSDEPHVAALRRFYAEGKVGGKDAYLVELERLAGAELGKHIVF